MNRKKITAFLLVLIVVLFLISIVAVFLRINNDFFKINEKERVSLIENWILNGSKSIANQSQIIPSDILQGKNILSINYNLHGLCVLSGEASSITIVSKNGKKYSVSLAEYGQNCYDGLQTIEIPLSSFEGLNTNEQIQSIHAQFWYPTYYNVEIKNLTAYHADTAVLGASTPQRKTIHHKTFPNISPIRPFPYAATSSSALE